MLPDGAWDNSWGTRNFKWTYWGSRTSDGCQPAYALLADRDPAFAQAAYRNTKLLETCTHDGVLYGGPHYTSHGVLPCIHHTFCHAKALAAVLDHNVSKAKSLSTAALPRETVYGVRNFDEIQTWLVSTGPWRGTITGYDWQYRNSYHASGGALSMLWHQNFGPVIAASPTEYKMLEPHNMQVNRDPLQMSLTPRVEMICGETAYKNTRDLTADVTHVQKKDEIIFTIHAKLVSEKSTSPPAGTASCKIVYRFTENAVEISVNMQQLVPFTRLSFILPVISDSTEKLTRLNDRCIQIKKQGGSMEISSKDH